MTEEERLAAAGMVVAALRGASMEDATYILGRALAETKLSIVCVLAIAAACRAGGVAKAVITVKDEGGCSLELLAPDGKGMTFPQGQP